MTEWLHFHFSLSCIGEGNGNPLQCSCLENPRGRGAWWAAVYGAAQSRTWLTWLSSSRLAIAFLPRSKHLLISCLQSPSAVNLELQNNKVCHSFHCFPIYLPWSDGARCHELRFFECWVLSQLLSNVKQKGELNSHPSHETQQQDELNWEDGHCSS